MVGTLKAPHPYPIRAHSHNRWCSKLAHEQCILLYATTEYVPAKHPLTALPRRPLGPAPCPSHPPCQTFDARCLPPPNPLHLTPPSGTGKSTLTAHLGTMLGQLGFNVLLVDADRQGNLSTFFKGDPKPQQPDPPPSDTVAEQQQQQTRGSGGASGSGSGGSQPQQQQQSTQHSTQPPQQQDLPTRLAQEARESLHQRLQQAAAAQALTFSSVKTDTLPADTMPLSADYVIAEDSDQVSRSQIKTRDQPRIAEATAYVDGARAKINNFRPYCLTKRLCS